MVKWFIISFILLSGIVFADDLDAYSPCGGDDQFIAPCYGEDYVQMSLDVLALLGKGFFNWLPYIILGVTMFIAVVA